jgi:hypothetical protein
MANDFVSSLTSAEGDDFVNTTFEACLEYRAATHDGPCEGCGWLAEDHASVAFAVVIPVPLPRRALRRAS